MTARLQFSEFPPDNVWSGASAATWSVGGSVGGRPPTGEQPCSQIFIFWNGFVILEEVDVTSIIQYCGEARYEPTKQSSSRKGLL